MPPPDVPTSVRCRRRILTSGWLWASITTTAVNDQVLKARYPGLVTGKLSDIAGVTMLALLATALTRRRAAVLAVGAAFVVLKTVPGRPRWSLRSSAVSPGAIPPI